VAKLEDMERLYPGKKLKLRAEVWEWIDEHGGKPFLRKLIYKLFDQAKAREMVDKRRRRDVEHFKKPGIAYPQHDTASPAGLATEARRARAEDDGVNYEGNGNE